MTPLRRLLVALLLAAGGAARADIVVRDDRGAEHRFAQPPARIVSLLPSLTESLCALGGCARLVGIDRFSNWPAAVRALPRLGGLDDPQVERTVALRPDVVLAAKSARIVDRLEALGVPVVVLDSDTHADVQRSLDLLAQLLGTPAAGPRLWAEIQRQIDAAAARVPARWRGRSVYFEVASTPHAAGAASFLGQTLARLGLVDIAPASLGAFPQLNPEFVVRAQPAIVMAVKSEIDAMPARPGWAGLQALRQGRVCGFDAARYDVLVRPGPRLGEAAGLLADCIERLPAP